MSSVIVIIVGMALVTYIPRLAPFYMLSDRELNPKIKIFLEFIPYTAIGALIFPGILSAIPGHLVITIIGVVFAFFISWKKGGMIMPVIGTISLIYLMLLLQNSGV